MRTLRSDPRIRVFHNCDDFLLSQDERVWLDSVLGKRITWGSGGGHLGNLYLDEFRARIVAAAAAETLQ